MHTHFSHYFMKILATILIAILFSVQLNAQITIGIDEQPVKGALLQLKNISDIADGSANATKGLLLPRVALENKASLVPVADNTDPTSYTGLIVYNTTQPLIEPTSACDPTPASLGMSLGLKVWSGSEWEDLLHDEESYNIPPEWISPDVRFIKDHEGNVYPVKQFADEGYWMLENLRTKSIPNGRGKYPIRVGTSFLDINNYSAVLAVNEARYQYPSPPIEYKPYFGDEVYPPISDDTFFKKYPNEGLLYNYFMSLNGEEPEQTEVVTIDGIKKVLPIKDAAGRPTSFVQGICPDGWHVPYNQEYESLFQYITDEFNAGNSETSGVDMDFQSQNNITIPRLPLTNCLPDGNADNTRGASKIALKGGFAAMWIGADSPYPATQGGVNNRIGPKEYGVLAVFSTVYDMIYQRVGSTPTKTSEDWVGNIWIRPKTPHTSNTDDWISGKSFYTNMYPVRCKKNDNTDSGILEYKDVYQK